MILLTSAALVAAQVDHFATPPTHAKLVKSGKTNVDPGDIELAQIAPDLTQKIEAVYVYGTLNGQTGAFVRMQRTPIVTVLLDTSGGPTTDTPIIPPYTDNPAVSNEINAANRASWNAHYNNTLNGNRARMATQHIMSPGVAPDTTSPWMPATTPSKKAWHFTDQDMDAVATLIEPRLEGTIV